MKWILYALLAGSLVAGGLLVAAEEGEQQEEPEEFIPTEKVPAGSTISFPVDI